jgi:hypothetical protein
MAKLNSLNKIASAPPSPDDVPEEALFLIEIEGQVYKISLEALAEALG